MSTYESTVVFDVSFCINLNIALNLFISVSQSQSYGSSFHGKKLHQKQLYGLAVKNTFIFIFKILCSMG